jgi:hypothetical protein
VAKHPLSIAQVDALNKMVKDNGLDAVVGALGLICRSRCVNTGNGAWLEMAEDVEELESRVSERGCDGRTRPER